MLQNSSSLALLKKTHIEEDNGYRHFCQHLLIQVKQMQTRSFLLRLPMFFTYIYVNDFSISFLHFWVSLFFFYPVTSFLTPILLILYSYHFSCFQLLLLMVCSCFNFLFSPLVKLLLPSWVN